VRLRVQLVVLFGLLVAVATSASGLLAYAATSDEAVAAVDGFLEARAGPRRAGPGPTEPIVDEVAAPNRRLVGDDSVFTLLGADGGVVVTSDGAVVLPPPTQVEAGVAVSSVSIDGVRYRLRSEVFNDGTAALAARSLAETEATLSAVRNRLLVIGVLITSAAVIVAWFVAGRLARPLQRLSAAAEHITATGDLDIPLDTSAPGEVGQVASSFSGMLEAFRRSNAQQQQLVVDAGHELRTPLTTLRANVELLASGRLTAADSAQALKLVGAELEELTNLTVELVELAGDQPIEAEMTAVDLDEVAHAAAARARARSGREITVEGPPTRVAGSAAGLDRAISNLLGNALKFSTDGTPIEVKVGNADVVVQNAGPKIPEDDLERVFERFYRVSTSRSLPGSGLGLAIVAAIAAAHGGRAFARNTATGVEMGFTLGTADSDEARNWL
jgi:two-component system sensor histidine kinase MprB